MPICKHLKPVAECPECRPKTERVGVSLTAFGPIPMAKEDVKAFDEEILAAQAIAANAKPKAPKPQKPKRPARPRP